MRCAAFVMLTLLLPTTLASGGRLDGPAPAPLAFFGGDNGPDASEPGVLITEAYYNALRPDEYVAVASAGTGPVDLGGWTLTDGEGTLTFPPGAALAAN